jgi:hypothetical protein
MNDMHEDRLAARARAAHADALEALSPRTRAQLHNRLRAALGGATQPRRTDWRWVAAPALALAIALALPEPGPRQPAVDPGGAAAVAAALAEAPVAPLEQDPEFYAWLGSADALALASE